MKPSEIAARRLRNQQLVKPHATSARDIVAALGAVQAQDYPGAKWGIAQRLVAATDATIESEITSGAIVRTHVLRPTWHFVAATDIRWMLELTAPRVNAANAFSYRYRKLDDAVFRKSRSALVKALEGGNPLTRDELATALKRARIDVEDRVRVAHIMMRAELDGVVCSGPRRGKQFTYALLDERVPACAPLDRDEALGELARRYFLTRGPATIDDMSWWSGLTKADCRRATEIIGRELRRETIDDRMYWSAASENPTKSDRRAKPLAHLLPNYDEYFVGFRDRSAMVARLRQAGVEARTDALSGNLLAIDGQVVGGWRRTMTTRDLIVDARLLVKPNAVERRAIEARVTQFGEFMGVKARLA